MLKPLVMPELKTQRLPPLKLRPKSRLLTQQLKMLRRKQLLSSSQRPPIHPLKLN
jgi:hypothetical protein